MTQIDETIDTNESPTTNEGTDRRAMLRKMAIGGAGAAVAVTALGRTAEAADGAPDATRQRGEPATRTPRTPPTTLDNTPGRARPESLRVSTAPARSNRHRLPATVGGYGRASCRTACTARPRSAGFGVVAANSAPGGAQVLLAVVTGAVAGAPSRYTRRRRALRRQRRHAVVHGADRTTAPPRSCVRASWPAPPTSGAFHVDRSPACLRLPYHRVHAERAAGAERLPRRERRRRPQRGRRGQPRQRCAGRRDRGGDQPDGCRPDRQELPGGGAGRCDGDVDIAAQLEPRRDADRQLDHGQVGRRSRKIKVFCGDQAGSTQFIVDVFGYYI